MARTEDKAPGENQEKYKPLSEQHKVFVQDYLLTGNATQAYRKAFGTTAKETTVAPNASRLLKRPHIVEAIARLRAKVANKTDDKVASAVAELRMSGELDEALTIEAHLKELKELRDLAKGDKRWAAAIAAEVKRGEVAGHYVTRSENLNVNYDASDISDADLARIASAGSSRVAAPEDRTSEPDRIH